MGFTRGQLNKLQPAVHAGTRGGLRVSQNGSSQKLRKSFPGSAGETGQPLINPHTNQISTCGTVINIGQTSAGEEYKRVVHSILLRRFINNAKRANDRLRFSISETSQ